MTVWVEGILAMNFLVDFLLLQGTARLSGLRPGGKRLVPASALGAVYGAACLVPGFRFLGNLLWRTVSLLLMGFLAFGFRRESLRRCGIFTLLSFALGGFAGSLHRADFGALTLSAAALWGLCRVSFRPGDTGREYIPLEITWQGRHLGLLALRDTGNSLHDPITGEPVLVLCAGAAARLTGLTRQQLLDPMATLAAAPLPGLRLIPYRTVGQGGMLLARVFSDVLLDGKRRRCLIAFSPENFGSEGYQALTGGSVSWGS